MAKRISRINWQRTHKVFKEWVALKRPFLWDTARNKIEVSFSEPAKVRCSNIATRLEYLAAWSGGNGVLQVLSSRGDGWEYIQKSLQYWFWSARILIRFAQRDKKPRVSSTTGALCLAHALAAHEDEIAEWCGQKFLDSLEDKSIFSEWQLNPFGPFMTKLYALWKGIDLQLNDSLGVYQQVIDTWNEPGRIADALVAACDYHCQRMDGEDIGLEFEYNPYGEFAAEILAIRRVREDLGLETPDISHSLLNSPLANPPEKMPAYEDELLERVIEFVKEDLPGV